MSKYRVSKYDAPEPIKKKSDAKPGDLPADRIPIFDHKGRRRGHVGVKASSATVARFTGQLGAKLGERDGRPAWISPGPNSGRGANDAAAQQNARIKKSLRAAKGSNR